MTPSPAGRALDAPVLGPEWRESWALHYREPFPPDVIAWLVGEARKRLDECAAKKTIPSLCDIYVSRLGKALAAGRPGS